jgi:hypothetical protein
MSLTSYRAAPPRGSLVRRAAWLLEAGASGLRAAGAGR